VGAVAAVVAVAAVGVLVVVSAVGVVVLVEVKVVGEGGLAEELCKCLVEVLVVVEEGIGGSSRKGVDL